MRSIWKGSIAFGLVNVPVKVYSATEDHDLKFHQVHAKDNGRIRYKRVCEVCGEVVEFRDIARAYESDDGQTVIITDEDIATMPEERSREIEVVEFVPASDIDPLMYDRSYFLEPDGKSSKSYVLLAKTLMETDRVAIVHFALRNKTRLAALRVKDFSKRDVMVIHTLLWPDEIRDPDFPVLDKEVQIKPAELKMAGQVVESMTDEFDPDQFRDTYQEQLHELVQAKLEGGEAFTVEEQPAELDETEDVSDLLAKLEASVKARRSGGDGSDSDEPAKKAPAKKAAAKRRPPRRHRPRRPLRRSRVSQPPERAVEPHFAEIVGRLGRFASSVAALEPSFIPAARQPPQRRQVHDVAPLVRGARQPGFDTGLVAEQPLVCAGAYDVVPHM